MKRDTGEDCGGGGGGCGGGGVSVVDAASPAKAEGNACTLAVHSPNLLTEGHSSCLMSTDSV